MGALLDAQGKYAEVEKLLALAEAETRRADTFYYFYYAFVHGQILLHPGNARAGQGKFAGAELDLLEAQAALAKTGFWADTSARRCDQALVGLYHAWDVEGPGKGYDPKAVEWKRRLDRRDVPTPSAAVH